MPLLLVVEDETLLRWALSKRLRNDGHKVLEAPTISAATDHLQRHQPDIVLLDIHLPDGNGLDLLTSQRLTLAESHVIVMTAGGTIEDAVSAMKLGAWEFLAKPVDQDELAGLIRKATWEKNERLEAEGSRRSRERAVKQGVIAVSRAMKHTLEMAEKVATASATTVLLHGETGVGKEVVARFIHARSPRSSGPLQALNCAAIPEQLVESELFGHEKGAFTDAKGARKGLFEIAQGGTVVLDEIGELPTPMQSKLLRFLEERSIRRVGGSREIAVDVRILALTNRNLEEQAAANRFRSDLLFRLNVFPILVPPLRERPEDILPLAREFMEQSAANCGKSFSRISPEFETWLQSHKWTGNVRELRNTIERAVILESGEELTGADLVRPESSRPAAVIISEIMPLDEVEHLMVTRALLASEGNQSQAARMLKVSRDQLRYRLKRYRDEGRLPESLMTTLNET